MITCSKEELQLDEILRKVEASGEPFRDPLFPAGPGALGEECAGTSDVVVVAQCCLRQGSLLVM